MFYIKVMALLALVVGISVTFTTRSGWLEIYFFKDYQKTCLSDIGGQFYRSVFPALFAKIDKYCKFFSMKKISNVFMNDCNYERHSRTKFCV